MLSHLEGSLSGRRYDADQLIGLDPADGRPLLARYEAPTRPFGPASPEGRRGALWRWKDLLPVRDERFITSLGEGGTPLLEAPRTGRLLGFQNLRFKAESLNPTGSFKARGMAVAVSRAIELGARSLVAPSAGNAAGALAAYAAAAGVPATVVMPTDAPQANKDEVLVAGARLVLMDGLISDCGRFANRLAADQGAFDLSTLKEPYRVEGKKTMGFELAEQCGWSLPDAIVYPAGGGTGLIGLWKAFAELEALGLIGSGRPRMLAIQSEGCAPNVRAFQKGERFAEPWAEAETAAAGIRVPGSVGDFLVLDCIRESEGAALAVPEAEIRGMQARLAAAGAGYLSLETAAAALGALLARESGLLEAGERVVIFDTGAGFKSESPNLPLPDPISADANEWEEALRPPAP
ncbi:MAG TPA: threonine synthase [Candidatus Dormibacteraeota bacterium]